MAEDTKAILLRVPRLGIPRLRPRFDKSANKITLLVDISLYCASRSRVTLQPTVLESNQIAESAQDIQIQEALRKYWGFDSLRPLQHEVVEAALGNRDAVVVLPTGGGKSLCFQLPAVVSQSLTVVISPLIALMKDQVDALTVVGVESAALNSSLSAAEEEDVYRKLADGTLRLLYVSPERLLSHGVMQVLKQADSGRGVARFAIDEAHCISAWGHDFRPEFRQLSRIKEVFPGVPVQAFTATATPKVQRDIAIQLHLERPRKFVGVFDRPNLTYRIVAKDDPVRRTVEAVQRYPDEGVIVYCLSRKDTESIANALVAHGIPAVAYHAGLPNEARRKISEDFATERANIIVATVAFGMGIDRANVRCVIHECLPKSMEGYQQETGRAGRDGLPSECVLLYSHGDVTRLKKLLLDGDAETNAHHAKLLEEVRQFASSHRCRHKSLSEHFGQTYEVPDDGCGACDVCLGGMAPLENSTQVAHQILATALDLLDRGRGRSFGVAFLVSVLAGSRAKRVLERHGEQAQGFGAFSSETNERIASWIHQLMDLGLMNVSEGEYPVVEMTDLGRDLLDSQGEVQLMENVALIAPARAKKSKSSDQSIESMDDALFEKLRAWRRSIASERGVPAYVIFHDATLMRVSAIRPSSVHRFRAISGVGDRRSEEFGEAIVAVVNEHCAATNTPLDQSSAEEKPRPVAPVTAKASSYHAHFVRGTSIEETAELGGVKPSTVWAYLATWIESDRPKSIAPWVAADVQEKAIAAFKSEGIEHLKPAFEHLEGAISYEVLRVVRAFVRSQGSEARLVTT